MSLERRASVESLVRVAFALTLIATLLAAVYVEDTPEVIYDKEIKLTEEVASIIYDNQNNCDLMGSKLGQLIKDNAAFIRKVQTSTSEQKKQGAEKYKARGRAACTKMVSGLIKCHTNAKVKAAMEKNQVLESRAADDTSAPATTGSNTTHLCRTMP
jgi:hypothetical protein